MTPRIVPPVVVVNENGEVQLYPSLEEAGNAFEPADIEDFPHRAFDAAGTRLTMRVMRTGPQSSESVVVELPPGAESAEDELRAAL